MSDILTVLSPRKHESWTSPLQCLVLFHVNKMEIKAPQALHNTPPLLGAPKVIL